MTLAIDSGDIGLEGGDGGPSIACRDKGAALSGAGKADCVEDGVAGWEDVGVPETTEGTDRVLALASSAAPRSASDNWPGGTCHVAFYMQGYSFRCIVPAYQKHAP